MLSPQVEETEQSYDVLTSLLARTVSNYRVAKKHRSPGKTVVQNMCVARYLTFLDFEI